MVRAVRILLPALLAIAALLPAVPAWAAPSLYVGEGGIALGTWKSALTTVLLAVALLQFAGQSLGRGWIRAGAGMRRLGSRLHRPGGIVAFTLAWLVFALCMYAMWGPGGSGTATLPSPRILAHAILGGGLLLVLSAKAVITNFLRRQLRLNMPLGIAALALSLGVWLTSAMPHLFNFYW